MKSKPLQASFIFLLVLFSLNFFGFNFLDERFIRYSNLFFCSAAAIAGLVYAFKKNKVFELPVQLICISVIASMLMAYISWGQNFLASYQATVPLFLWVLFFYLLHIQLPVKMFEVIVFIYAFAYLILYFFQFLNPEILFFGVKQQYSEWYYDRGIFRIIFPGGGVFFLSVFIALNKLTTQRKGRLLWLLFCVFGLVIPVMQATRTYIAGVVLIYGFHFLKDLPVIKKLIVVAAAGVVFIAITKLDVPVFKGLALAQQQTEKDGLQNQRIITGIYFLREFSPNIISNIFGNGVPSTSAQTRYKKFVDNLGTQGIFMYDVGIIGMFAMFGILAVVGYIIIWIKSFVLPLPKNFYYVKYYLWFLVVTSLTYDAVYSNYFLITTVFTLYIFQKIYEEEKLKINQPLIPEPVYEQPNNYAND